MAEPSTVRSRNFVDPEHPPLVIGLLRAMNWFEESMRLTQQARGLQTVTRAQGNLLIHIAAGERRAVRIARKLGVARQTVSTLVNELVAMGIVTVEPDPDDARAQLLDFSAEHAAQGPKLLELFRLLEEQVGMRIGADRLAVLRHALNSDWGDTSALKDSSG